MHDEMAVSVRSRSAAAAPELILHYNQLSLPRSKSYHSAEGGGGGGHELYTRRGGGDGGVSSFFFFFFCFFFFKQNNVKGSYTK